jgi:hypothetical protein
MTHMIYQVSPDGAVTEAPIWGADDASVLGYVQRMRLDNPDHRYQLVRV